MVKQFQFLKDKKSLAGSITFIVNNQIDVNSFLSEKNFRVVNKKYKTKFTSNARLKGSQRRPSTLLNNPKTRFEPALKFELIETEKRLRKAGIQNPIVIDQTKLSFERQARILFAQLLHKQIYFKKRFNIKATTLKRSGKQPFKHVSKFQYNPVKSQHAYIFSLVLKPIILSDFIDYVSTHTRFFNPIKYFLARPLIKLLVEVQDNTGKVITAQYELLPFNIMPNAFVPVNKTAFIKKFEEMLDDLEIIFNKGLSSVKYKVLKSTIFFDFYKI